MAYDDDNIFAKIINKRISTEVIIESEYSITCF